MTAVVPSIHVYLKRSRKLSRPGMAGKIAVIGAFNTTETTPQEFFTLDELQDSFGDDTTFNGCAVAPYLFNGASSLLCVNITTWSSATPPVPTKTITTSNLASALAKIKGEDWDILFIADILTADFIPIIDAYLDATWEMKYPSGFMGAINGANVSANVNMASLCGEHCYGVITQSLEVEGETLNLLNSSAHYCSVVAGMNVGNTMTMKVVPGVTGLGSEYSFETGGEGKAYVEAGLTTFKCQDRGSGRYIVVNSEQPNGYDLYINRVRDFVVKEFSLHQFLGERNRQATLTEIEHEVATVKDRCINDLDLLEDIKYHVEKHNSSCVDIFIEELLFAGIITRINMYVHLEVE